LQKFEKHLYDMKQLIEATIISPNLTQTELDSFANSINSNRTSVNTKITSLNSEIKTVQDTKENIDDYLTDYKDAMRDLENTEKNAQRDIENSQASLKSKELNLEQAKQDYEDLLAPLTASETAAARSRMTSASVSLEKAQLELKKATIESPIAGVVAMLSYKTGDIIVDTSASNPVAIIINNDTLFIEVPIEEADINKIELGQVAYANFDSLDDLQLQGEVSFISLTSQTSNNNIVTYLVRVLFENSKKEQIREGMTALADFVIAQAKDVLVVPVSAVRNIAGKPSVELESSEERVVITGFTDGDYVEIISGLEKGEKINY
jgi:RND family efflux transporter MFP subunit